MTRDAGVPLCAHSVTGRAAHLPQPGFPRHGRGGDGDPGVFCCALLLAPDSKTRVPACSPIVHDRIGTTASHPARSPGSATGASPLQFYRSTCAVTRFLYERYRIDQGQPDDFYIRNMTEMTKALASTSSLMMRLLLCVAMISLVVGGGIMNIMLLSVTGRTHRRCGGLGHRRRGLRLLSRLESVQIRPHRGVALRVTGRRRAVGSRRSGADCRCLFETPGSVSFVIQLDSPRDNRQESGLLVVGFGIPNIHSVRRAIFWTRS
jgi:hypothetical protein